MVPVQCVVLIFIHHPSGIKLRPRINRGLNIKLKQRKYVKNISLSYVIYIIRCVYVYIIVQ